MSEEHATLLLGAYVLGALDADERDEVERHLADCPDCAAELSELLPMRDLLAQLDAHDVEELTANASIPVGAPPSPDLFARLSAAVENDSAEPRGTQPGDASRPARRRRFTGRTRLLAVAAAVVVLAGAGTGVGLLASDGHHGSTLTATAAGVRMSVDVTGTKAGTTVALTVAGLPANEHCTLVAVAGDGSRHPAAEWEATYTGDARFTGWTDVPRSQLRQLVLLGTDGNQLVSVNL